MYIGSPVKMSPLNLDHLQHWIETERIDPTKPITFKELCESRCLHGIKDGVKLLGRVHPPIYFNPPPLTRQIGCIHFQHSHHITVSRALPRLSPPSKPPVVPSRHASSTAKGILQTAYPHHFPEQCRLADATSRKDLEYYRNPEHRGYLASTLKPGDNPESLFFKKPEEAEKARNLKRRGQDKKQKATDKLW
ncbi:hypothetical protein BGX38DRAFT_855857 [Terfezia claveryi]|nr:hypothetical protein BGX38DRAFT_855857 [Terfezia claveryi]